MSTPRTPDESGQVRIDPSHIKAVNEDLDALEELLPTPKKPRRKGREPEPPEPRSTLAIRADGKLLVSVEDAEGRDLRGRELVTFLVLDDDAECLARTLLSNPLCEVAARLIGKLPRRKP